MLVRSIQLHKMAQCDGSEEEGLHGLLQNMKHATNGSGRSVLHADLDRSEMRENSLKTAGGGGSYHLVKSVGARDGVHKPHRKIMKQTSGLRTTAYRSSQTRCRGRCIFMTMNQYGNAVLKTQRFL
jgi:hypothetical protein